MRHALILMLTAGLVLTGCESPPERAGNTIDLYNDLATTYPTGAKVNVSYRFEYLNTVDRPSDGDGSDRNYLFAEAGAPRPQRFLKVRVVAPSAPPTPTDATRLWLGTRRYMARADCYTVGAAGVPPAMDALVEEMGDRAPAPGTELFVRVFYPETTEADGQAIQVVFAQDLAALGLTCEAIGNPGRPSEETATAVNAINADARRSFEIMG